MEDVLWHRAERVAKDLDRTPSWVIREALEQYLERHKAAKLAEKEEEFNRGLDKSPVAATKRRKKL